MEKRFFKGDIVHHKQDKKGSIFTTFFAMKLYGMLSDQTVDHLIIWHRPFKNKIKHLIYKLKNRTWK